MGDENTFIQLCEVDDLQMCQKNKTVSKNSKINEPCEDDNNLHDHSDSGDGVLMSLDPGISSVTIDDNNCMNIKDSYRISSSHNTIVGGKITFQKIFEEYYAIADVINSYLDIRFIVVNFMLLNKVMNIAVLKNETTRGLRRDLLREGQAR